jgi:hypothetical protein
MWATKITKVLSAIRDVRNFVTEDRLDFLLVHQSQQPSADRDEGAIAEHPGREGIRVRGIEDGHLGHADARLFRLALDRTDEPLLDIVRGALDHVRPRGPLRYPFGDRQREDRASKPEQGSPNQHGDVRSVGWNDAKGGEHRHCDGRHEQDGEVGSQKQQNSQHSRTPKD